MKAPRILALLPLLVLSACISVGGQQRDPVTTFAPDIRTTPDPDWPRADWALVVAKPSAPRTLDSSRIAVRPVSNELQVYRGANWAQPAPDMLQGAVLRALEDSGRIAAVARADAGIRSDYRLLTDIRRFESDYAGQPLPSAVIEVNALLLSTQDQRVVASRTFEHAQPATGTAVPDVVAAFEQSMAAVVHDIAGWTLAQGQADAQRTR